MVVGAEAEHGELCVRFATRRGDPPEIEDRIPLGPRGELSAVRGVGRFLRILRAGRVRAPLAPYDLACDAERAAELVRRCRGAEVRLRVTRRVEHVVTVWTESGVDRFAGVVDYAEDADGLWILRRGGGSRLRIPRRSLVRFSASSRSFPEVLGIDLPTRTFLN